MIPSITHEVTETPVSIHTNILYQVMAKSKRMVNTNEVDDFLTNIVLSRHCGTVVLL